ncbi:14275_t:CDS:2, partial [Funneliformis caledonium]
TSDKIIIEQSVYKEKKDGVSTVQQSTSTEKVHEIVSNQKDDGSLQLTDTVSKELTNKGTKLPESNSIIETAVTLSYLQKTSSADSSPEVKQKFEKAKQYLSTHIKDEKVEIELLEKTDKIVVDHATKKVVKEKAHKVVLEKVQETVTVEEEISTEDITNSAHEKNNKQSIEKQIIRQLKLNHGLFLNEYGIQPSQQAIFKDDGKLRISSYNEQPIVYTNINDPDSTEQNNFNNVLQPFDACINFPIAEITFNGSLLDSFANNNENLNESFGQFFVKNVSVGDKLFIKGYNTATQTQVDLLKFYLLCVYNLAKFHNTFSPLNNFSAFQFLSIETLDGKELDTPKKLADWMKDLYQNNNFDIISYDNLIPISQLKRDELSEINLEAPIEKQPGVANFKEKLSFQSWTRNVIDVDLARWIKVLPQCLVINNKSYKLETSKKFAANFIKVPNIKSSDKSYLEFRPTTKVEEELMINNIFSIKDLSSFPFVDRVIESDDSSYDEYNLLVKLEKYEILINRDHVKPSIEFVQAINDALESVEPFEDLQVVFEEYGHLFAQKIILGRIFKRNVPNAVTCKIDLTSPIVESLEPYLNKLNIPYLLTQQGNIIEKNELFDLIQHFDSIQHLNDLEIIELDEIIPLYKILDEQQQSKIDIILNSIDSTHDKI